MAEGFGAMLADVMLPADLRYDERARAVCLRIADVCEALCPTRPHLAAPNGEQNRVDPHLADGLR